MNRSHYPYGTRTADQRKFREAWQSKDAWECDNPACEKRFHYNPRCIGVRYSGRQQRAARRSEAQLIDTNCRISKNWAQLQADHDQTNEECTMRVEIKKTQRHVSFNDLRGGDTFLLPGINNSTLFMKLKVNVLSGNAFGGGPFEVRNAVSFPSGVCIKVGEATQVIPMLAYVNAEADMTEHTAGRPAPRHDGSCEFVPDKRAVAADGPDET